MHIENSPTLVKLRHASLYKFIDANALNLADQYNQMNVSGTTRNLANYQSTAPYTAVTLSSSQTYYFTFKLFEMNPSSAEKA